MGPCTGPMLKEKTTRSGGVPLASGFVCGAVTVAMWLSQEGKNTRSPDLRRADRGARSLKSPVFRREVA